MRQPTVAPIHNDDGFAVKVAVPREQLTQVIPLIKLRGGTDIIVLKPWADRAMKTPTIQPIPPYRFARALHHTLASKRITLKLDNNEGAPIPSSLLVEALAQLESRATLAIPGSGCT